MGERVGLRRRAAGSRRLGLGGWWREEGEDARAGGCEDGERPLRRWEACGIKIWVLGWDRTRSLEWDRRGMGIEGDGRTGGVVRWGDYGI